MTNYSVAKCNALIGQYKNDFPPKVAIKSLWLLHVGSVIYQVILVTNENFGICNATQEATGYIKLMSQGTFSFRKINTNIYHNQC